jgi:Coenzyme PQQ synthesis protein D (PqqD)
LAFGLLEVGDGLDAVMALLRVYQWTVWTRVWTQRQKHTGWQCESVTMTGMNYRHNPSVVVTDLDDELVLLDPVSKQMFSLNTVGRLLWLELPRQGLDGVLEQITKSFAVSPEQARADAMGLIESLSKSKLLELINPVTDSGTLEVTTDSGTLEVM